MKLVFEDLSQPNYGRVSCNHYKSSLTTNRNDSTVVNPCLYLEWICLKDFSNSCCNDVPVANPCLWSADLIPSQKIFFCVSHNHLQKWLASQALYSVLYALIRIHCYVHLHGALPINQFVLLEFNSNLDLQYT